MYEKLLGYLEREQQDNGFYPAYAYSSKNRPVKIPTPFFSYLICNVLAGINETRINVIQYKIAHATQKQASIINTYNYWVRDSEKFSSHTLPDDWDDTALALSLLSTSGIRNKQFPYKTLRQHYVNNSFETWITSSKYLIKFERWKEQDVHINLNILYTLALNNVLLPNVWDWCIINKNQKSRYYLKNGCIQFLFARLLRFYSNPKMEIGLIQWSKDVLQKRNPLIKTAFAIKVEQLLTNRHTCSVVRQKNFFNQKPEPHILGWQICRSEKVFDYAPSLVAALILSSFPKKNSLRINTNNLGLKAISSTEFGKELTDLPEEIAKLIGQKSSQSSLALNTQTLKSWEYYYTYDAQRDNHDAITPKKRLTRKDTDAITQTALKTYLRIFATPRTPREWLKHYLREHAPYIAAVITCGGSTYTTDYTHYLLAKQLSDDLLDLKEDLHTKRDSYCTQLSSSQCSVSSLQKQISYLIIFHISRAATIPSTKRKPLLSAALRTLQQIRENETVLATQKNNQNDML